MILMGVRNPKATTNNKVRAIKEIFVLKSGVKSYQLHPNMKMETSLKRKKFFASCDCTC